MMPALDLWLAPAAFGMLVFDADPGATMIVADGSKEDTWRICVVSLPPAGAGDEALDITMVTGETF